jgi:MEMO1 family protein
MTGIRFVALAVLVACIAAPGVHAQKKQETKKMEIRHSSLDSQWYAASSPAELRALVERFMSQAKDVPVPGTIIGIVSPHAGYRYSGPVAGYSYRKVQGKHYDTVVVVAPNHADSQLRFSSVFNGGAYETPLGSAPVDTETAAAIAGFDPNDTVKFSGMGHRSQSGDRSEHSLEIQLPFLQVALGSFKLVPIVMGDQSEESCEALAKAIAAGVKGKNFLLVASSDMSHFFTSDEARKLDDRVRKYIEAYDPSGLVSDRKVEQSRVCGAGPIAAVMMAARQLGATKATVLRMANSGDETGDTHSVVGYLAAALTAPGKVSAAPPSSCAAGLKAAPKVGVDLGLTEKEKDTLREVVKKTLDSCVKTGAVPECTVFTGNLGRKLGAFVTLTKHGELRGCIGNLVGTRPLITTIAEMTREAALGDPRFPRVQPNELKDIEFEISVLTPIRRVKDVNEIVIGRDGIIMTQGYNKGLLLPQVATEWGWDLNTFLEQTCRKAGLPKDAWKDKNTVIEAFSAEVFK